jgi:hypothetical protein
VMWWSAECGGKGPRSGEWRFLKTLGGRQKKKNLEFPLKATVYFTRMASRRRMYAVLASITFGTFITAPTFVNLIAVAGEVPPEYASTLATRGGVWEGEDSEGDQCILRFNSRGMVSYETPEVSQKGPPVYTEGSLTIAPPPVPLLSQVYTPLLLPVTKWPTESDPVAVINGVTYKRLA